MHKLLLYISFLILSQSLCSQELVPLDHRLMPMENSSGALYLLEAKEIDSTTYSIKIFYSDNKILMEGQASDSQGQHLMGSSTWYYKNGTIQSEGNYNNGQKTGSWKRYNPDGSTKPDRHYSDVNMSNIIFNSALKMPRANTDQESFEDYIVASVIKERAFEIVELSPISIQLVISKMGRVQEAKFDDRLSNHNMHVLDEIIKAIPSWRPGSNGTQNINVRVNYKIEFPKG